MIDKVEQREATSREKIQSSESLAALDWMIAENKLAASVFAGKVDVSMVAAMDMSWGGLQAIEISLDLRISKTIMCNSVWSGE